MRASEILLTLSTDETALYHSWLTLLLIRGEGSGWRRDIYSEKALNVKSIKAVCDSAQLDSTTKFLISSSDFYILVCFQMSRTAEHENACLNIPVFLFSEDERK